MITEEQIINEVNRLKEQEQKGKDVYFKIKAIVSLTLAQDEMIEDINFVSSQIHKTLNPVSELILLGDFKLALFTLETTLANVYCTKELLDFITNTIKAEIGIE